MCNPSRSCVFTGQELTRPMNYGISKIVGRGAQSRPANRFERIQLEIDVEAIHSEETLAESAPATQLVSPHRIKTEFLPDASQSILSHNDSPDVGFNWSINPYRGCEHGCAYCYARPTHEYLGLDAGLDFESKILVKHDAPELLRAAISKASWQGEIIVLSGVTDCYQPIERQYRLTRGCLEVMLAARQAFGIVTKNALVVRDLDLLQQAAALKLVHVNVSVTTLDAELARSMEPRTSLPEQRLAAIRQLSSAGVPVRVLVAPIIPGLNDQEIPAILAAVRQVGASSAGYILLRLPHSVRPVFHDWLAETFPDKLAKIESLIRDTRGGRMNESDFETRHSGRGNYAEQIAQTFDVFARKEGLEGSLPDLDLTLFERPDNSGQKRLF